MPAWTVAYHKNMWVDLIYTLHSADVVYVIGGGVEVTGIPLLTQEVIGVNIATREVFAPSDIIHSVCAPAAAASINRLAVCGGVQPNGYGKSCQLYSPKVDRYAQTAPLLIFFSELFFVYVQAASILVTAAVLYTASIQQIAIIGLYKFSRKKPFSQWQFCTKWWLILCKTSVLPEYLLRASHNRVLANALWNWPWRFM